MSDSTQMPPGFELKCARAIEIGPVHRFRTERPSRLKMSTNFYRRPLFFSSFLRGALLAGAVKLLCLSYIFQCIKLRRGRRIELFVLKFSNLAPVITREVLSPLPFHSSQMQLKIRQNKSIGVLANRAISPFFSGKWIVVCRWIVDGS